MFDKLLYMINKFKNNTIVKPKIITTEDFIKYVSTFAIKTQKEYKVLASITIAQAILESDKGKSFLATNGNALFGIKADSRWAGKTIEKETTEYINGKITKVMAKFRAYKSWEESIIDHGKFLFQNQRYAKAGLFDSMDYKKQAVSLQKAGYATDPKYPDKLIQIIEKYNLNKFDKS